MFEHCILFVYKLLELKHFASFWRTATRHQKYWLWTSNLELMSKVWSSSGQIQDLFFICWFAFSVNKFFSMELFFNPNQIVYTAETRHTKHATPKPIDTGPKSASAILSPFSINLNSTAISHWAKMLWNSSIFIRYWVHTLEWWRFHRLQTPNERDRM